MEDELFQALYLLIALEANRRRRPRRVHLTDATILAVLRVCTNHGPTIWAEDVADYRERELLYALGPAKNV